MAEKEETFTGTTFSTGRAMQEFLAPPGMLKPLVLEAMDDLQMTVIQRGGEGTVSRIEGKTADNRNVAVTIRPNQVKTRVSCRIGWFGDEPLSTALLQRIGVRLGTMPPAPIPAQPPSTPAANPIFSRDAVPDAIMLRDLSEAPYRDRVNP
jgi:hypothetical protein